MYSCTVLFGVNTHSVPTVDQFLRVEWTAAFPLWTLDLAQRDTVHGARCVVLHGARIYSCTGTVLVECAHLHESDLSTFDLKLHVQYWYHRTSTTGSYQLSCTSSA